MFAREASSSLAANGGRLAYLNICRNGTPVATTSSHAEYTVQRVQITEDHRTGVGALELINLRLRHRKNVPQLTCARVFLVDDPERAEFDDNLLQGVPGNVADRVYKEIAAKLFVFRHAVSTARVVVLEESVCAKRVRVETDMDLASCSEFALFQCARCEEIVPASLPLIQIPGCGHVMCVSHAFRDHTSGKTVQNFLLPDSLASMEYRCPCPPCNENSQAHLDGNDILRTIEGASLAQIVHLARLPLDVLQCALKKERETFSDANGGRELLTQLFKDFLAFSRLSKDLLTQPSDYIDVWPTDTIIWSTDLLVSAAGNPSVTPDILDKLVNEMVPPGRARRAGLAAQTVLAALLAPQHTRLGGECIAVLLRYVLYSDSEVRYQEKERLAIAGRCSVVKDCTSPSDGYTLLQAGLVDPRCENGALFDIITSSVCPDDEIDLHSIISSNPFSNTRLKAVLDKCPRACTDKDATGRTPLDVFAETATQFDADRFDILCARTTRTLGGAEAGKDHLFAAIANPNIGSDALKWASDGAWAAVCGYEDDDSKPTILFRLCEDYARRNTRSQQHLFKMICDIVREDKRLTGQLSCLLRPCGNETPLSVLSDDLCEELETPPFQKLLPTIPATSLRVIIVGDAGAGKSKLFAALTCRERRTAPSSGSMKRPPSIGEQDTDPSYPYSGSSTPRHLRRGFVEIFARMLNDEDDECELHFIDTGSVRPLVTMDTRAWKEGPSVFVIVIPSKISRNLLGPDDNFLDGESYYNAACDMIERWQARIQSTGHAHKIVVALNVFAGDGAEALASRQVEELRMRQPVDGNVIVQPVSPDVVSEVVEFRTIVTNLARGILRQVSLRIPEACAAILSDLRGKGEECILSFEDAVKRIDTPQYEWHGQLRNWHAAMAMRALEVCGKIMLFDLPANRVAKDDDFSDAVVVVRPTVLCECVNRVVQGIRSPFTRGGNTRSSSVGVLLDLTRFQEMAMLPKDQGRLCAQVMCAMGWCARLDMLQELTGESRAVMLPRPYVPFCAYDGSGIPYNEWASLRRRGLLPEREGEDPATSAYAWECVRLSGANPSWMAARSSFHLIQQRVLLLFEETRQQFSTCTTPSGQPEFEFRFMLWRDAVKWERNRPEDGSFTLTVLVRLGDLLRGDGKRPETNVHVIVRAQCHDGDALAGIIGIQSEGFDPTAFLRAEVHTLMHRVIKWVTTACDVDVDIPDGREMSHATQHTGPGPCFDISIPAVLEAGEFPHTEAVVDGETDPVLYSDELDALFGNDAEEEAAAEGAEVAQEEEDAEAGTKQEEKEEHSEDDLHTNSQTSKPKTDDEREEAVNEHTALNTRLKHMIKDELDIPAIPLLVVTMPDDRSRSSSESDGKKRTALQQVNDAARRVNQGFQDFYKLDVQVQFVCPVTGRIGEPGYSTSVPSKQLVRIKKMLRLGGTAALVATVAVGAAAAIIGTAGMLAVPVAAASGMAAQAGNRGRASLSTCLTLGDVGRVLGSASRGMEELGELDREELAEVLLKWHIASPHTKRRTAQRLAAEGRFCTGDTYQQFARLVRALDECRRPIETGLRRAYCDLTGDVAWVLDDDATVATFEAQGSASFMCNAPTDSGDGAGAEEGGEDGAGAEERKQHG